MLFANKLMNDSNETDPGYETAQRLSTVAFTEMKNNMYVIQLVTYLKHLAHRKAKPIYAVKEEGLRICQLLIQKDEADDRLLSTFDQVFTNIVMKERDFKHQCQKHFIKNLSKQTAFVDSLTDHDLKSHLKQLQEINEAKESWKEETYSDSNLPKVSMYFYNQCLNNIRDYFEEPLASLF